MGDELDQCADGISQIERHAEQLGKYLKDLDRRGADVPQLLKKVEEEMDSGRYLTEETGRYLKDRLREQDLTKMSRMRLEKLARQFEATGGRFETVSRTVLEKQRALSGTIMDMERGEAGGRAAGHSTGEPEGQKMQLQAPLLEDGQVSFAMQNVVERNEEMKQLESDLGELHTLFKDVATLASMQQEDLDTIEGAVTEANVRVVGGVSELLKAKKHQRRARKRMCCMVGTGAVVVTILVYWIIAPLIR
mmetsp:Transcript_42097/g.82346  ORF Transcript_42097/g.82346 Transcript_42097/m.82346 type:complete len:249 (+) Transcript_42097:358-1104(+)